MRMLALAVLTLAASISPLDPARAQSFTLEQMRGMCRGEVEDAPQFRTRAANQLVAESYRLRCRMYLLGLVDGLLRSEEPEPRCISPGTPQGEVTEPIVEALLSRSESPEGGVATIVRDVLRSHFGCAMHGTAPAPAD